jgi:hypothetical protein
MGCLGAGWEIWLVESAGVCQLHLVSVWKADNEAGHSGWDNVCGWCIGCQEVASSSGVKDGPLFYGGGIDINCFEEDGGCKGVT